MKRKMPFKSEPVIAPEILEQAKRSLVTDNLRKPGKCSVCGADTSLGSGEPLCWVCRRLARQRTADARSGVRHGAPDARGARPLVNERGGDYILDRQSNRFK